MRQEELKRAMDESWREGRLFERARAKGIIDMDIKTCQNMQGSSKDEKWIHIEVALERIKQKLKEKN